MALSAVPSPYPPGLPLESSATDEELVRRIVRGERRFCAVLIRRNNQKLFRIVRSIVRDDHDAEDVVQTAYVRAFSKLDQFRGDSRFSTWLTRIAINEALHSRQAEKNRNHVELVEESANQPPAPEAARDPEEAVHLKEVRHMLERQIDALPEALRVVLVMRDVQELTTQDTALTLGISEEAVRVRLHRARGLLEQRVSGMQHRLPEAFHFAGMRCQRMLLGLVDRLDLRSDC